jgi:hypothetical protein
MMLRQFLSRLSLLVVLLSACTPTVVATPTPATVASPTAAVPPSPTASQAPTASPTAAAVPSPSPVELTATPASTLPPDLPSEAILLLSPGLSSRVTSPVTVSGIADSTFENNLVVEIRDVEGNVIGLTPTTITAELGGRGPFETQVEFDPPAEEGPGRIVVYDASARDGHLVHLASVIVTLLPSGGAADIRPRAEHPETIVIEAPALLDVISGGVAHVSGFSGPTFEQNLQLDVLDENGVVVGSSFTTLETGVGEPGPFEGDVSYSVASEQPGSIQVYATSPMDGSIEHLASVEVILQP